MVRAKLRAPLVALALLLAPSIVTAKPKIVAVFDVQDRTGKLDAKALGQLTDYLAAQVTSRGYRVLPRAQLKARLKLQKKESYKSCYDEKCQIEVGRELAAQKSISTQIVQIGSKCAVVLTLYDLRSSASEKAATKKAACNTDALVVALEEAVKSLGGAVPKLATAPPQEAGLVSSPPKAVAPALAATPKAATPAPATAVPAPSPAPAPSEARPFYKKWWVWAIVVGVAVAAGVTVAVIASSGGTDEVSSGTPPELRIPGAGFSF